MPELIAADAGLARLLIERGLALVYLVAFVVAARQFPALCGERGLEPATRILSFTTFRRLPTIFQLGYSDRRLLAVAWVGATAALLLVIGVPQQLPLPVTMATWFVLWALYLSIV